MEGFDLASLGWHSPEAIHLMVEAKKLAFADRERYLADPNYVDVPVEGLLSKDYAADRRKLIDPERAAAPEFRHGRRGGEVRCRARRGGHWKTRRASSSPMAKGTLSA